MISNKPKLPAKPLPRTATTPPNNVRSNSNTRSNSSSKQNPLPTKPVTKPAPKPTTTLGPPKTIPKPMPSSTTAPKPFLKKSLEPKGAFINAAHKNKKRSLLESTSFYMWEDILVYCIDDLETLVSLARVCKLFYKAIFERAKIMNFVIMRFYGKELKENPAINEEFKEKKYDLDFIIDFIQRCEMVRTNKKTAYFLENYMKIFEYGHIKENVLNKLIEKLNIKIDISWNRKRPYYALNQENYPFKMKFSNNMSHILLRVEDVKKLLISDLSVLDLVITVRSSYLRRRFEMSYLINKSELYDESNNKKSTRVFNYFIQKNLLFVYFHQDTKILYMLCDISILEVLTQFYNQTKARASKALKAKRVLTPIGTSLVEYVRQQLDFEVHFCLKNHKEIKYYFITTTTYPKDFDEGSASFRVPVGASFTLKNAEFKLDDDLGINQVIKDFFLADFVLKDKDNILIVHSGFMEMKEMEVKEVQRYVQNYMNYTDEWFTNYCFQYATKSYSFMVTCTKDARRNDVLVHEIFIDIKKSIFEDLL